MSVGVKLLKAPTLKSSLLKILIQAKIILGTCSSRYSLQVVISEQLKIFYLNFFFSQERQYQLTKLPCRNTLIATAMQAEKSAINFLQRKNIGCVSGLCLLYSIVANLLVL